MRPTGKRRGEGRGGDVKGSEGMGDVEWGRTEKTGRMRGLKKAVRIEENSETNFFIWVFMIRTGFSVCRFFRLNIFASMVDL
jgi:hypothetical protein